MQNNLKLAGAGLLILAIGMAAGRFTLPAKIVVKTETKTVIQEVTKTAEVDHTRTQDNKVLTETTTKKPDGTVVTQKTWVDKSIITNSDTKDTTDNKDTTTDTKTQTTTTYATNTGSLRVLVGRNLGNADSLIPGSLFVYGLQVEKKFLGPISVGAFGMTDKTLGLTVGLNF